MRENVEPSAEAQLHIGEWQKAFKDRAPGTSTLRAKTRGALQNDNIQSGDAMMMAMLVGDKVYLNIGQILESTNMGQVTQDKVITEFL